MKNRVVLALAFAACTVAAPLVGMAQKEEVAQVALKVGDKAPDFTLLSDEWKPVKLSDFHGKKNVLLAVYILAFTGG